ncbi:hypothetical protein CHARACLAT_017154 [Characodon lateralis]|uniref:Uncharacterized protein n=1 Tax=Characodon lateralis TaxID=208331 RepID=A0ABU7EXJ4_9TELE|nr:hypothetical protein [Characodon lateralis]
MDPGEEPEVPSPSPFRCKCSHSRHHRALLRSVAFTVNKRHTGEQVNAGETKFVPPEDHQQTQYYILYARRRVLRRLQVKNRNSLKVHHWDSKPWQP